MRPKFKSWLHCLALGKCLSHSVPEFPVFTKLIPMTIKHLLCAKHFYLWLLPQPALRRLEVVSSPPFYKQITKTWWGWRLVPPSPGESHAARLCCGPCCRGNLNAESDIIYSQLQPACDVMRSTGVSQSLRFLFRGGWQDCCASHGNGTLQILQPNLCPPWPSIAWCWS